MSDWPPKPRKLTTSLDRVNDLRWREEPNHSDIVADQLLLAFALLGQASSAADDYVQVFELSQTCLRQRCSKRQRMQAYFAKGTALLRLGVVDEGIDALDNARVWGEKIADLGACAVIAHLAGSAERGRARYRMAVEYQSHALDLVHLLSSAEDSADPPLELAILSELASFHFMLGQYEAAERHLDEARRFRPFVPSGDLRPATIEWVAALVLRWQGRSELALRHALAAAEVYARHTSPYARMSWGRVSAVVADTALDLADSFDGNGHSQAHTSFLVMAEPYVMNAQSLARDTGDTGGMTIASLTEVRLGASIGRGPRRITTIEQIARTAESEHDITTVCQALTALGRELAIKGEIGSALRCYRRAHALADENELPALGVWAHRELLRYAEHHV